MVLTRHLGLHKLALRGILAVPAAIYRSTFRDVLAAQVRRPQVPHRTGG
ncbi:hypothetical protein [Plantactinospora sp. BB1]|nr:hypothetical protein [Plantactinospora sp. BB1]